MSDVPATPARDLVVGDVIDLREMIAEMTGEDSMWVPFGGNDTQIAKMMSVAKMMAERERATVSRIDDLGNGFIMIYTDQLRFSIPSGFRFDVEEAV